MRWGPLIKKILIRTLLVMLLTVILWIALAYLFTALDFFKPVYPSGICGTHYFELYMEQWYKIFLLAIAIAFPAALLAVLLISHAVGRRRRQRQVAAVAATTDYGCETDMIETQFDE